MTRKETPNHPAAEHPAPSTGNRYAALLLGVALIAVAPEAQAQDSPKLVMKMSGQKEVRVQEDGRWVLKQVPLEKVSKGDVVVYSISYANEGKAKAREASIIGPIPEGTAFIPESARGRGAVLRCSIDGGKSFHEYPARYTVEAPDGTLVQKVAPAEMYTHVKWLHPEPILPGQEGHVSFKVSVR